MGNDRRWTDLEYAIGLRQVHLAWKRLPRFGEDLQVMGLSCFESLKGMEAPGSSRQIYLVYPIYLNKATGSTWFIWTKLSGQIFLVAA